MSEILSSKEKTHGQKIDAELAEVEREMMIEKYRPQFLGEGSEHVVFSLPHHPNIVAKVEKHKLHAAIFTNLREGKPLETVPEQFEEKKEAILKRERQANRDLKRFFGEAVLGERPYIMHLPVTKELVALIEDDTHLSEQMPKGVHKVIALVRLQEKAPEQAFSPDALSPTFSYREMSVLDSKQMLEYEVMNEVLLDAQGELTPDIIAGIGRGVPEIVEAMQKDDDLRKAVKDFAEKAIEYVNETGEMLDLAGPGNISFFKNGAEWEYLLIDGKYPSRDIFSKATSFINAFLEGKKLSVMEANVVMNALNFTRCVNALAAAGGSEKRLLLSTRPLAPHSRELYHMIQEEHHS